MRTVNWTLATRIVAALALVVSLSVTPLLPNEARAVIGTEEPGGIFRDVIDCTLNIVALYPGYDVKLMSRYLECLERAEEQQFSCLADADAYYQLCLLLARVAAFPLSPSPQALAECRTGLDREQERCSEGRSDRILECASQAAQDGVDLLCPGPIGPCFILNWFGQCASISRDDIIIAEG